MASGFSAQEHIFIIEYLRDFDRARAAKEAGYSKDSKDFYKAGTRLLQRDSIQRQLNIEIAKRDKEVAVDALYIIDRLRTIVEANLVKWLLIGKKGATLDQLEEMPEELQKMVTEIKEKSTFNPRTEEIVTEYTFKFMSKDRALELLGKYKGLFDKRVQVDLNVNSFEQWANRMIVEHEKEIIQRQRELDEKQRQILLEKQRQAIDVKFKPE